MLGKVFLVNTTCEGLVSLFNVAKYAEHRWALSKADLSVFGDMFYDVECWKKKPAKPFYTNKPKVGIVTGQKRLPKSRDAAPLSKLPLYTLMVIPEKLAAEGRNYAPIVSFVP
jgi:hypothetical protein